MHLHSMLAPRTSIYSDIPPDYQDRDAINPTLLTSWWATIFSVVITLVRLAGRFIRVERLFSDDKMMAASVIPLLIRMGFVHVILIWGTNNMKIGGLDAEQVRHRDIGSRLVLAARVFYAIT